MALVVGGLLTVAMALVVGGLLTVAMGHASLCTGGVYLF
jgi:hypothetical protein